METPPLGRNILQRVGTPASTKQERTSPSPERNMNMKQENPTFLVPPLWKDSLSLENIANDFLDSNVTGEVMKLDDFLKELQSSDVQEDMDDLCGGQGMLPQPQNQQQMHDVRNQQQDPHNRYNLIRPANIESLRETSVDHQQHPQLQDPHGQHPGQLGHSSGQHPGNRGGQPQDHHGGGPVRPPIMHHVGKPPELYNHNLQESSTTGIPQEASH